MAIELPAAIAGYFASDLPGETDNLGQFFTEDAHVHDEGEDYDGRDEIVAWRTAAKQRYTYTAEPLAVTERDSNTIVRTRLEGNFPGSPVDVDFIFRLRDGLIAGLEVA